MALSRPLTSSQVKLSREAFAPSLRKSSQVKSTAVYSTRLDSTVPRSLRRCARRYEQIEIKAAYKQRALEWHPDKHTHSEEARLAAEAHFKLLGEALEILGDEFQRKLYNEGYDKEAIVERVNAANRAASNHNKDGCCGGGGGCGGCG